MVVTDADGDSAPAGNLVINIVDDVPTAVADTDSVAAGTFAAGDRQRADRRRDAATATRLTALRTCRAPTGRWLSGVAAGTTNADLDNAATLGTPIQGTFGKLTLAADGSYSYDDANTGTAAPVTDSSPTRSGTATATCRIRR